MIVTTHEQYNTDGIGEEELEATPMAMFAQWFRDAVVQGVPEPEAMALSTTSLPAATAPAADSSPADKSAWRVDAPRPSTRMVLLKRADDRGFQFFTNYESRKSAELEANPWCSLTFYWHKIHRSVRVLGRAVRLPRAESQAYYDSRPVGSRIGAWASPQSRVLTSRHELTERLDACKERFHVPNAATMNADVPDSIPVPLPAHWGGFLVVPDEVEFWIGRVSRLHDRFRCVVGSY
ncbi:pyridoxal 5'-phosphate synthase [Malassezia sp. CBS 17886]|nr:pyridoxal 5'-phosphate synthase [Malassezia sp. CBS 17886]